MAPIPSLLPPPLLLLLLPLLLSLSSRTLLLTNAGVPAAAPGAPAPAFAAGLPGGPPVAGWSTWNTFACSINATLVKQGADHLVSSGLLDAGYEYILIDDCWSSCADYDRKNGYCKKTGGRDEEGRLIPDPVKFPDGMKDVADYVHSVGAKFGIYTAIGPITCGGYEGSAGHEETDVRQFAEWGVDFLKHDYCNANITDVMAAVPRMRKALDAVSRDIVYYVDADTTERVYDPSHRDPRAARNWTELPWSWGPVYTNMWKTWKDIYDTADVKDTWWHIMDNVQHNARGTQRFQSCGKFNMPDMLTIGQGGQSIEEYKSQMALWSVMASPLINGADIRNLDAAHLAILTNKALLEINRDPMCAMGSMSRGLSGFQTWVKPLSPSTSGGKNKKSFFLVLLNTNDATPVDIPVVFDDYYRGDFEPTDFSAARVYDLWHNPPQLLGEFKGNFTAKVVMPHSCMALRMDVVEMATEAPMQISTSDSKSGDCSDVTTFGARGDFVTNDTTAIQLAIDTCALRKQTLVIGAGVGAAAASGDSGAGRVYRIAALDLRSNLHMTLKEGAILRADNDTNLWPKRGSDDASTLAPCRNIISGDSIRNITIDGGGLIDGQGQAWWDLAHRMLRRIPPVKTDGLRPRMMACEDCSDFAVRDVRMLNSPSFHLFISGVNCEVTDISIQSPKYGLAPNTDGIDVACDGAYIARNHVVNGDDSLCVKSPGSNILFENNYAEQGNGIVIGTSSHAQISNITYRNCVSNRTAYGMHIKFKDNQTGSVKGVLYENLTVIQPYRYVMGINQNDQGRRRRLLAQQQQPGVSTHLNGSAEDAESRSFSAYHPMANVSIGDITYRNIRTVGGLALSAGHFQCDVTKHGHEDGVKGPPCIGLTMEDIHIESVLGCEFEGVVQGKVVGTVEPVSCIPPH